MNKYFASFAIALLIVPSVGFAQSQIDQSTGFQQTFTVEAPDILVPTVVEVDLSAAEFDINQFMVRAQATQQPVASLFRKAYAVDPFEYTVSAAGRVLAALTDDNYETTENFPVTVDGQGSVTFAITGADTITASAITMNLAPNVALPTFASVTAVVDGVEEVVVARTAVTSRQISFPQTISPQWSVTLEHAQPLRLSELQFTQLEQEATVEQTLRFLAQPNTTYEIYFDPEFFVALDRVESGDLVSDQDVLVLDTVPNIQNNPLFALSDTDDDSIPDQRDNCVQLANPDQLDINQNGRGDVCDDFDRDSIINSLDNCPDTPNRQQADEDNDGIGDDCDTEESRVTEKYAWIPWAAMGGALLVFAGLFAVVLRRKVDVDSESNSDSEIKLPAEYN